MPTSSPWVVKKRGVRTTSPVELGYWSELLLSLAMIAVGGVALGVHIAEVLVPEWQRNSQLSNLQSIRSEVLDKRIESRDILNFQEYAPSLKLRPLFEDSEAVEPIWTTEGIALFSPHRDEAEQILAQYEVGDEIQCWYDATGETSIIVGRRFRWWPWPVALLPASLLAVGIWGLVATLLQVTTSIERRRVVSKRVGQLDPLASTASEVGLDATGSFENPGVRLAYRLPIDNAHNWRLVGMIFVNTLWNSLLIYFGYVTTQSWMRGNPRWLASWLVLVLGAVGVWLAFRLIQELWNNRRIGVTQLEISQHPIAPGESARVFLQQTGRGTIRRLVVHLVCEEHALFLQGTDARQWVEVVYDETLREWKKVKVTPGQPFDAEFGLDLPETAMHTFVTTHNQIRWWLVVRGVARDGREFKRRFPIDIQPRELPVTSESSTDSVEATP